MATITAGDFRNGKTFEMDGKVMQVVEFQHVKPGKGASVYLDIYLQSSPQDFDSSIYPG